MKRFCISLSCFCALFILSCKNEPSSSTGKESRLQYAPQVNQVEVVTLSPSPFNQEIFANGKLVASRRSRLYFRTTGMITEILAGNGRWIRKGDVLARVDDREKRLALESARLSVEKAELDLFSDLAGLGYVAKDTTGVPKDVLLNAKMRSGYSSAVMALERSLLDLDHTCLCAPYSGKVADLAYKTFDMVGSDPFCTLIDDSSYDVEFQVFESEIPGIAVGRSVQVYPFAQGSDARDAVITSVNPSIDKNGQILVKARLKGDPSFMDGMNVRVIVRNSIPEQLIVPKAAVVIRDNEEVVFRYKMGKAEWVYVKTQASNSTQHVIKANQERGAVLSPGDSIIISGNLNLADGSSVTLKSN